MNRSIIALAAALTAGPAFADSPEYPPGLFDNSPVVPSGPPSVAPSDRQMQRFLWTRTQTFLLDQRTAAACLTTFALASISGLSAVWLKSGRRTLGAIRRRIDRAGVHRGPPESDRDPHSDHRRATRPSPPRSRSGWWPTSRNSGRMLGVRLAGGPLAAQARRHARAGRELQRRDPAGAGGKQVRHDKPQELWVGFAVIP